LSMACIILARQRGQVDDRQVPIFATCASATPMCRRVFMQSIHGQGDRAPGNGAGAGLTDCMASHTIKAPSDPKLFGPRSEPVSVPPARAVHPRVPPHPGVRRSAGKRGLHLPDSLSRLASQGLRYVVARLRPVATECTTILPSTDPRSTINPQISMPHAASATRESPRTSPATRCMSMWWAGRHWTRERSRCAGSGGSYLPLDFCWSSRGMLLQ